VPAAGNPWPGTRLIVQQPISRDPVMNSVIYIVGLVVVVAAILSFFGLR
jgi:hypothetical protein